MNASVCLLDSVASTASIMREFADKYSLNNPLNNTERVMSVLRGPDGKFYDVPDDQLAKYAVPPEKVRATLEKAGVPAPSGRGEPGGSGPPPMGVHGGPVVIQIYPPPMGGPGPGHEGGGAGEPGQVDPYWYYWWTRYWTRYYW